MRKRLAAVLGLFVFAVTALWLGLPSLGTFVANQRLGAFALYDAHIDGIDLRPWQKTVVILGFRVGKRRPEPPAMFFSVSEIHLRFSLKDVFNKRLVADCRLVRPAATWLLRRRRPGEPPRVALWRNFAARLPPFNLRNVTLQDARFRFFGPQSIPPLKISFSEVRLRAQNLANRKSLVSPGPVVLNGKGKLMDQASMELRAEIEPFRPHATLRLWARAADYDMRALNVYLRRAVGVDLAMGRLTAEGEFVVRDGAFSGRLKRVLDDINVRRSDNKLLHPSASMKEWVLQRWINWKEGADNRLEGETRIFGSLGYKDQDVLGAGIWVLRHAFLQSLHPILKSEIGIEPPEIFEARSIEKQEVEYKKLHP